MVRGPPAWICFRKVGITLPRLPSTLPNRTAQNTEWPFWRLRTTCSASHFDAPMTLAGLMALSVEMNTNRSVPADTAASARLAVPRTLVVNASAGCSSSTGTCLWAAAWKTISG